MKKLLVCILVFTLIGCMVAYALGDTYNLHDLQNIIYNKAPRDLLGGSVRASIKGVIKSIECVGGNHYNATIQVDDPEADCPMGADAPYVIGHFRLHLDSVDDLPFHVGDDALIVGELNSQYSTCLVPYIMIDEFNGYDSDEF
jgi:hypothetical protein